MSDPRASIRPGSVKICSLREVEHAAWVVETGADLFGLIFVPGVRRQVTVERAREIVAAARAAGGARALAVGVFVDATAEEINEVAVTVGLDLAQLHGRESPDLIASLSVPAIKALRPVPGATALEVAGLVDWYLAAAVAPVALLVDSYHPEHHGGEGLRADWALAAELSARYPVVLAGGLDPTNVAEAVRRVRPLGVDVSSGVEKAGAKDRAAIAAFVREAKAAFVSVPDRSGE